MKTPKFITFTGIDDRTDLTRADQLARTYPIEWGVLFSSANRDARYPCSQAIDEILEIGGQKSAHLCGQYSLLFQSGVVPWIKSGFVREGCPLKSFDRCQVNGRGVSDGNFAHLSAYYDVEIIKQTRHDFAAAPHYRELFDCSGGRGVMPAYVPSLREGQLVGFAGGMGPDTVLDYLGMIEGEGEFWIDMEGRVRTNGWFDLDKVERVCELVYGQ